MLADLLGGEQVQAAFDNLHASVGHIRAGRLRALAVTTVIRSEALPHVPSLSELSSGTKPAPSSVLPHQRRRRSPSLTN